MEHKEVLYFSIVTFLIAFSWIAFDVYHAVTTRTVTQVQEEAMKPLQSEIDHETILRVVERQEYEE